jgi:hypothetical protein
VTQTYSTWDDWDTKYNAQPNHLVDGTDLYETYGDEHAYILQMAELHPRRVWTIVCADDADVIMNGYHYVNRVGYMVTDEDGQPDEEFHERYDQ